MSTFPQAPLDLEVDLDLSGWTSITSLAYQREGASPAAVITRGRANEQGGVVPTSVTMEWNNRSGNLSPRNPTGTYYGLLGRNTPVRLSVPAALNYLRIADDDTSYASCPGTVSLELSADIDARIDMMLDNWAPCFLMGQWNSGAQNWALTLNGDGTVTWTWTGSGPVIYQVSSTMPVPLGRVAVRAYFDPAGTSGSPQVIFYTAPNMSGSFTQLGNAVAITSANYALATETALAVGYSSDWAADYGQAGLQGAVYEARVYSGATLEADPVFSSQTAGTTSFTDGQSNTWTLSGSAAISGRNYRAHAECTTLPQRWDPTGTDVWTPVQAKGVFRRLQQNSSAVPSAMRRGIKSVASSDGVVAYWPCEDSAGSTQIASGLTGGSPMTFTGAPSFQATTGSPSADSNFPCSTQLAQVQSSSWTGQIPGWITDYEDFAVQYLLLLVYVPSGVTGGTLLSANTTELIWSSASGGTLEYNVDGTLYGSYTGAAGVPLCVLLSVFVSSFEAYCAILPAGQGASSQTIYPAGPNGAFFNSVQINPASAAFGATEVGHIASLGAIPGSQLGLGSAAITTTVASWAAAWTGETAGNRVLRLCSENSIAGRVYGYPNLSIAMGPQSIDTLANLLQYCEDADRGQLYEPAEALGVGYRTLGSLCSQSAGLTLNYASAHIGISDSDPGLQPVDDDSFIRNDETLTRNLGSSVQVQVTSGPMSISAPPNGVGDYDDSLTVYNAWDADLARIAGWMTWTGTCDEERYPGIPLNLARTQLSTLVNSITALRIGDYFTIQNLISQMPPGGANQLLWGYTESLGGFWWQMALNAVPEDPYAVAVVGSFYVESAGTELATGVSSTATSMSMNVTGTLWATGTGLSIPVLLSGEQMTVTAISGASSPQTFTVTRSVNQVVKSQSAGAALTIAQPPVAALAGNH